MNAFPPQTYELLLHLHFPSSTLFTQGVDRLVPDYSLSRGAHLCLPSKNGHRVLGSRQESSYLPVLNLDM